MTDLRVETSRPEAMDRFRAVAQALVDWNKGLSPDAEAFLRQNGHNLGLHTLDVERILTEIGGTLPSLDKVNVILTEAITAAESIEDLEAKVSALCDVARTQQTLNSQGSEATLRRAIDITRTEYGVDKRVRLLCCIAEAQTQAKEQEDTLNQALYIAHHIAHRLKDSSAYTIVAKAQARAGNIPGALATVRLINSKSKTMEHKTIFDIVLLQMWSGDISGALITLTTAEAMSSQDRSTILGNIVDEQIMVGDCQAAFVSAQSIEDPRIKVSALCNIARAQIHESDIESYYTTLAEALNVAQSIDNIYFKVRSLCQIARSCTTPKLRTLSLDMALASARRIKDPKDKVSALGKVIYAQQTLGIGDSHLILVEARAALHEITDTGDRNNALYELNINTGDFEGAAGVAREIENQEWSKWSKIIGSIHPTNMGEKQLFIGERQLFAGDIQGALTTAKSMETWSMKVELLGKIVRSLVEIGDHQFALQVANDIEDHKTCVSALCDVALAQQAASVENWPATMSEALTTAQIIETGSDKVHALCGIALAWRRLEEIN